MNRTFKASGILLWQENVNVTLSGHEAAPGADTFLGAPLQTELPAPCLQQEMVYSRDGQCTRAVPAAMQTALANTPVR